jgi:hypothetical protein
MTRPLNPALRFATLLPVVVAAAVGCPEITEPRPFGAACTSNADCADPALQCRSVDGAVPACVPPRQPTELGERCENAFIANDPDGAGPLVVDERVLLGSAIHDVDVCGVVEAPDVSIRFTLAEPKGLFIRVDDPNVVVGLREVVDGDCRGPAVRFGCATSAAEALLPTVAAGEWELVVDGPGTNAGTEDERPVRVTVEEINCPLGGVPHGSQCLVYQTDSAMLRPRAGAGGKEMSDGNIVTVGGVDQTGRPNDDGEVLDPITGERFFVEVANDHLRPIVLETGGLVVAVSEGTPLAVEIVQFRASFNAPSLEVRDVFPPNTVFTAAQGDVPFVFTDQGEFRVAAETITCDRALECGLAECREGSCACTPGSCFNQDGTLSTTSITGLYEPGDVALGVGNRIVLSSGDEYRSFVTQGAVLREERTILREVARDDVALAADDRFVYAFGGTVEGVATDTVELLDLNSRTVSVLSATAPVALAHPHAVRFGRLVVVMDEAVPLDEPLLFDLDAQAFIRAPLLPTARADVALIESTDGAIFAGGSQGGVAIAEVQRLLLVAPNRQPQPTPQACASAPLGADITPGSTGTGLDRFRDPVCFANALAPDEQWHVDLESESSLRVITEPNDSFITEFRVTVLDALCDPKARVVACGIGTVFVPSLPPGRYYVSVESIISFSPSLEEILGRPYTIQAITGAPESCPADEFDPGDDDALTARLIAPAIIDDSTTTFPLAEGSLCPGDVDHVLVDFVGGDELRVGPGNFATVHTATIAPTSTRDNIVIESVGAPVPFEEFSAVDQPAGFYVVRMAPTDGLAAPVEWFVQDTSDCLLDPNDSSLAFLDDGDNVSLATPLAVGGEVSRNLCTPTDVDLFLMTPDPARTVIVEIDDEELAAEAVAVVNGVLTDPLPVAFQLVDPDFGPLRLTLPANTPPFAVRVRHPDGEIVDDYDVTFDQPPPGDTCAEALVLTGVSGTETIASAEFRNDVNAGSVGDCTGFGTPGEDLFFTIDLATGDRLRARVTPVGNFDVAVYVLDACPAGDFADVCEVGEDQGGRGDIDEVVFTNSGAPGTFYIVVDSFFGESYSTSLTWSVE